ncbi:MAG TPA: hypothetical protein VGN42_22805 [Pirellulales bacterium]|nr:hypothetical protein [Pirellulales bacterium]
MDWLPYSDLPQFRADDDGLSDDERRLWLAAWTGYVSDPCGFAARFWPRLRLTPYQRRILESVRDNGETWVHSANKMGKSFVAALAAVWWFATRPGRVMTTARTGRHLKLVLWPEIKNLLRTSCNELDGELSRFHFGFHQLEQFVYGQLRERGKPDERYYIAGLLQNQEESFQGLHLPTLKDGTPTVLAIVDEASNQERWLYDAISSYAHRILEIGNPTHSEGRFYEICRARDQRHPDDVDGNRLFRKVIHVSGEQSPNVKAGLQWAADARPTKPAQPPMIVPGILSYQQFVERKANWSPYQVRTRLLGLFPDEGGGRLFPAEWLDAAQQFGRIAAERPGRPYALGVDVAQGGGDLTAWVVLGRYGVRKLIVRETPNTAEIAGQTIRLMRAFRIRPAWVAFDAGGGGKQIADLLRDRGFEDLLDVTFGAAAEDRRKYKNQRAELYGELREAMTPSTRQSRLLAAPIERWPRAARCLGLPPDDALLREDLAVLPLLRDAEGRLRLPPKDKPTRRTSAQSERSVRELLGGRSPDRGDALALAYYAWRRGREARERETVDRPLVF